MLFDLADPAYPWLVDALFTLADALTAYMMFRIARMQKASNKESAAISPALTAALWVQVCRT